MPGAESDDVALTVLSQFVRQVTGADAEDIADLNDKQPSTLSFKCWAWPPAVNPTHVKDNVHSLTVSLRLADRCRIAPGGYPLMRLNALLNAACEA